MILPFEFCWYVIDEIHWSIKRKRKNFNRDTSNSLADDYIEDRYGI